MLRALRDYFRTTEARGRAMQRWRSAAVQTQDPMALPKPAMLPVRVSDAVQPALQVAEPSSVLRQPPPGPASAPASGAPAESAQGRSVVGRRCRLLPQERVRCCTAANDAKGHKQPPALQNKWSAPLT
jgi:hypothetical protein